MFPREPGPTSGWLSCRGKRLQGSVHRSGAAKATPLQGTAVLGVLPHPTPGLKIAYHTIDVKAASRRRQRAAARAG